jgi:hypothetical protein
MDNIAGSCVGVKQIKIVLNVLTHLPFSKIYVCPFIVFGDFGDFG